jgi:hypothetical protein
MDVAIGSSSNANALGEGLREIFSDFDARVTDLKALLELRGLSHSEKSTLNTAELQLCALEQEVAEARAALAHEAEQLQAAQLLQQEANATQARLAHIAAHLPDALPGQREEQPPPPPPREPFGEIVSSRPASGATSARRGAKKPPSLPPVTVSELKTAPAYMKARLSVEQVNSALLEVQKTLDSKYALLGLPPSQLRGLSEPDRRRHAAYKVLEGEAELRGAFFVSDEDLKGTAAGKGDATSKNLLGVLRHVGRLKEIKHGGQRHYLAK